MRKLILARLVVQLLFIWPESRGLGFVAGIGVDIGISIEIGIKGGGVLLIKEEELFDILCQVAVTYCNLVTDRVPPCLTDRWRCCSVCIYSSCSIGLYGYNYSGIGDGSIGISSVDRIRGGVGGP